jgi:mono/diheme cytochrome c family protein
MKAKAIQFKISVIVLITLFVVATALLNYSVVQVSAQEQDTAAFYKAKCAMCHGQNSEKAFDTAKTDEQHVEAILKGVKPKMPSYEKSLDADKAKALVTHMRELKSKAATPGN